MGVDYKVSQIYDAGMKQVVSSEKDWKSVCRLTGRLYRYEFDNILMIYMQRPNATLVADYDTWKDPRVGRYVKRGSRGIAIFPSRALKPHMRYVFDISDTGGRETRLTWELDEEKRQSYAAYLGCENAGEKEAALNFLKDFTENRIGVIMDSEFGERITELVHLAGTKRILVDDETQEITAEEALKRSVVYAVFTRCGLDLSPEKQDFSFITAFTSEEEVYRLGSLVSDISCEVLRSIAKELTQTERSIAYGRNVDVSRGRGRDALSQPDITGGESDLNEPRQVRGEGGTVSGGEPQGEIPDAGEIRETGREDAGSGGGSLSDDGSSGERLSEKEPTEESGVHDGDVAAQRTGEDAGGGNRDEGSRSEIPLEEEKERKEQLNSEISRELEELEALGSTEKGSYEQASFSFAQNGEVSIPEKYTYTKPKTELVVPHDYIRQVLLKGSGFSHGKRRIYHIFETVSDPGERVKQIKKEYGQGGAGWPVDGYGLHGYDTYHGKGIRFQWRDEEGEKDGYLNWNAVERELSVLIMIGEYYQPPKDYVTVNQTEDEAAKQEELLWQEALKAYFNEEIQYISVKTLLYDIFTTNLSIEEKAEFLATVYGEEREDFSMSDTVDGPYGESRITRDKEGVTVSFAKPDGTRGEHREDYRYCASLILHMIEEDDYLSAEVFDKFSQSPQSFAAMPWFMDIYHEYKERMDEIRTVTRQLIFIQTEWCSDEELRFQQKLLNEKYDAYVKKFGFITGRGSRQAFQDDADYPLLCSLEVVDEDGNVRKADMFHKQTIRAKNQVDRVETASEALNVSVSEFGTVNIPFMLSIYEPDVEKALKELPEGSTLSSDAEAELKRGLLIEELAGLIYLDPTEYNENNLNAGWKTADEYLSGNVRDKLRIAKAYAEENGELFAANVQALTQVQPKDLDASEIEVRIGTTWIEPEDYEQFIYELLGTPRRAQAVKAAYYNSGIQIKYNTYGQNWFIENKALDKRSIAATKTYGTSRIDAYSIMEETLNLMII